MSIAQIIFLQPENKMKEITHQTEREREGGGEEKEEEEEEEKN